MGIPICSALFSVSISAVHCSARLSSQARPTAICRRISDGAVPPKDTRASTQEGDADVARRFLGDTAVDGLSQVLQSAAFALAGFYHAAHDGAGFPEGNALHDRQQLHEVTADKAYLAPDQLRHVGAFLLGHDAAAGAEVVVDGDIGELGGVLPGEFLRPAGQVHHGNGDVAEELQTVIPVADGVHGVFSFAVPFPVFGKY